MTTTEIILLSLSAILQLVGIIGSLVPLIPGAPLSFAGMLLCCIVYPTPVMITLTVVMGLLVIGGIVLDYVAPSILTNRAGGSKKAVWGTNIGLILGLLFAPPLGVIVGPFLGALVGELIETNNAKHSFKVAAYSFLSFLLGTLFKFFLCVAMLIICIVCVGVDFIPQEWMDAVRQMFA